jgi:hypothetical protein
MAMTNAKRSKIFGIRTFRLPFTKTACVHIVNEFHKRERWNIDIYAELLSTDNKIKDDETFKNRPYQDLCYDKGEKLKLNIKLSNKNEYNDIEYIFKYDDKEYGREGVKLNGGTVEYKDNYDREISIKLLSFGKKN